jgi:hypothetical protein
MAEATAYGQSASVQYHDKALIPVAGATPGPTSGLAFGVPLSGGYAFLSNFVCLVAQR